MDVINAVLSIVSLMDSFSIPLGGFSVSFWDFAVSLGVLETIAFILYGRDHS